MIGVTYEALRATLVFGPRLDTNLGEDCGRVAIAKTVQEDRREDLEAIQRKHKKSGAFAQILSDIFILKTTHGGVGLDEPRHQRTAGGNEAHSGDETGVAPAKNVHNEPRKEHGADDGAEDPYHENLRHERGVPADCAHLWGGEE